MVSAEYKYFFFVTYFALLSDKVVISYEKRGNDKNISKKHGYRVRSALINGPIAIIECYKLREINVEEALVEMYLAGVFVRRVEDITEAFGALR